VYKPAVIVANKTDVKGARANLKLLEAYVGNTLPIVAISCKTREGLARLGDVLFETLDITRIYTKEPNEKEFSKKPFILKKGATVYDLAKSIHSDFSRKFSFAKVWARRLVFSPQKVGSTFRLQDGDVVEIHVR
jgi:ribosome-interacting GTPase 1